MPWRTRPARAPQSQPDLKSWERVAAPEDRAWRGRLTIVGRSL